MQTEIPVQADILIHELIRKRHSPRAFAETPVPDAVLGRLFEAARWAPSSTNAQPWRFVVLRKGGENHAAVLSCLSAGNQEWAYRAPVLVAVAAQNTFGHPPCPNAHAWHDTGLAVATLTFQAMAEGVYVRQLAGIRYTEIREILGIPEGFDLISVLVIGYEGDLDSLPETVQAKERKPRNRKNREEIVFEGHWEKFSAL